MRQGTPFHSKILAAGIRRTLDGLRRNAIAWLALFVALGGTGLANSHYIITSSRQIKPSVMRTLRGARGPLGPAGPPGIPGPTGGEANLARLCTAIHVATEEDFHLSKEVHLEGEIGRMMSFDYTTIATALGGVYVEGCI
jgi:hypothetical protein